MKKNILTLMLCAIASMAMAQKPIYFPGDGVYIVGIPADQTTEYNRPVMVAEAYQATFKTKNATLASRSDEEGNKVNISRYYNGDILDIHIFMGIGRIENLVVRNLDGDSYTIGDYAPKKTWSTTNIVAGYAPWARNKSTYTLGVYDHWDCPVSFDADEMLTKNKMDAVTVDFGNPHEGLVCQGINFNLVSNSDKLAQNVGSLKVALTTFDEENNPTIEYEEALKYAEIQEVKDLEDGLKLYSVYFTFGDNVILNKRFEVSVQGFASLEVEAWIPRAVDTHDLYPTHTTYSTADSHETVINSDVCINIDGYFNYVGMWGWYDGKEERGEVVSQGDYVQIYYDPSDPDWPGQYFTGEAAFPIETTFGMSDLMLLECPDWIAPVDVDGSQWDDYECLLIIMTAAPLPTGETGRYGKLVVSTKDYASTYTIHIRQGNGMFPDDSTDGIHDINICVPTNGGMFDLNGRSITSPANGQIYIQNGKKYLK